MGEKVFGSTYVFRIRGPCGISDQRFASACFEKFGDFSILFTWSVSPDIEGVVLNSRPQHSQPQSG